MLQRHAVLAGVLAVLPEPAGAEIKARLQLQLANRFLNIFVKISHF